MRAERAHYRRLGPHHGWSSPRSPRLRIRIAFIVVMLALPALAGCARVQPWDRDLLADPRMQLGGDGVQAGLDDHIYFSKEASTGGRGFGGGGCGCN